LVPRLANFNLFHLCSHFYPATSIGGPIYCGIELLINLDKITSQKIFTYSTNIDQSQWSIEHNRYSPFASNSVISFAKHNLYSYVSLSLSLFSSILNKRCIFLHGTYNLQYLFALLFLKIFNYKCFVIPHGTLDQNRRNSSRSFLIRHLSYVYIKFLLYGNYLIFSNQAEYDAVKIVQKNSRKLLFISNFVPFTDESTWINLLNPLLQRKCTHIAPTNAICSAALELESNISIFLNSSSVNIQGKNRLTLFFFGRLSPEKGVDIVIPTLSKLYHHGYISGFVILGGTNDSSYVSHIRSKCAALNLPVLISGFISRPDAHKILQKFRPALIFPSVSDNFNLCLHECLNLGLISFASSRINSIDGSQHPLLRPFRLEDISTQLYQLVIDLCTKSTGHKMQPVSDIIQPKSILDSYKELLDTYKN